MISLTLTASPAATHLVKLPNITSLRPTFTRYSQLKKPEQRRRWLRDGKCRAELSADAPVAMAIGACILNSLIFPLAPSPEDMEAESFIDSADARFTVMGIISLIPYFNWMSWVFACLDTGNRRFAVYAVVYLAPYLRPNLSISPEESWLPISSILLCIVHIQIEASMKNRDFLGFQVLNEVAQHISSLTHKKNGRNSKEDTRSEHNNLLPAQDHDDRNQTKDDWNVPQISPQDKKHLNEDEDEDG